MGKGRYLIPVMALFFLGYFFLFPKRTKEEMVLVPDLKISLSQSGGRISSLEGDLHYFDGDDRMGYFSDTGSVVLDGPGRSLISDFFYIQDREDGLFLSDPAGGEAVPLGSDLTPLLFGDRIFLGDLFRGYLSEVDREGRIIWEYSFPSPVTCLDSRANLVVVGQLNGEAVILNRRGEVLLSWSPGGSRINVIYGVAFSPDGSRLALVSGLDPQRFIYLEKKENGYRPVFHENMVQNFRKPLYPVFDSDMNVIIEGEGMGLLYRPGAESLASFDLAGEYRGGFSLPDEGTLTFLSDENGEGRITLFLDRGDRIMTTTFSDEPREIRSLSGKIVVTGSRRVYLIGKELL